MTLDRPARLVLALVATTSLALSSAAAVLADSPAPGSVAPATSGAPGASGGNAISIIEKTFQPANLTIKAGDSVTWTVTQAIADSHSVTSGSYKDTSTAGKVFDSGIKLKNNGDSFSFTFTSAGTFAYFCAVHPDTMSGTITVTDANGGTGGGEAEGEGPVPTSNKIIAAVVLVVVLIVLFGPARLYQRMNRA